MSPVSILIVGVIGCDGAPLLQRRVQGRAVWADHVLRQIPEASSVGSPENPEPCSPRTSRLLQTAGCRRRRCYSAGAFTEQIFHISWHGTEIVPNPASAQPRLDLPVLLAGTMSGPSLACTQPRQAGASGARRGEQAGRPLQGSQTARIFDGLCPRLLQITLSSQAVMSLSSRRVFLPEIFRKTPKGYVRYGGSFTSAAALSSPRAG